jgi:hypothetical protein
MSFLVHLKPRNARQFAIHEEWTRIAPAKITARKATTQPEKDK